MIILDETIKRGLVKGGKITAQQKKQTETTTNKS